MNIQLLNPKQSLNKVYLKEKVAKAEIEKFKRNLQVMIGRINENESEEHLKNVVSDFLKDTWYKDVHEINTKDRSDLVIHTGKTAKDPAGVIIEAKKPSNRSEMISESKPNAKALQELVLYYLRERIELKNIDIRYLVITNIYEWYIIDEVFFEKFVFRNNKLKKDYENWKISGKDTRFFYESIAKPFLDSIEEVPSVTYFDIRSFEEQAGRNNEEADKKLIPLYKILSPAHLLKQPFKNDSNSLDKKFYLELLHIIGLEETSDGNKKIINRKADRDDASLIENIITKLDRRGMLSAVKNLTSYGLTRDVQMFNIALDLSITWMNRLLFLKLLEAQLFNYHKRDKDYLFLNSNKIVDFDELGNLFFDVLAERIENRTQDMQSKFPKVPYLNSSLFESTTLEKVFDIGKLDNRLNLPLYSSTVLKTEVGKRKIGSLTTLEYIFQFLDAYDFTSEGSEQIQEENKNLINASVLGLIFEKINGYKEGSFFTPGFVTMHMSKEVIRKCVIQKFNEKYNLTCDSFDDLKNYVGSRYKTNDILEFNKIINSIKICDPAVGSGHFLVSALNEMVAIKADLGILSDSSGVRLTGYEIKNINDELIVTYNNNSELYEYTVVQGSVNPDIQKVQKILFHEKELIIEYCLFGVDLNPNSVKICSLRLWIELLKSAYYTYDSNFLQLETLPNIDINIKCGNSLISRFELDDDLDSGFKKIDYTFDDYKDAVKNYKLTKDRAAKAEIISRIEEVKNSFQMSLDDKFITTISKARGKVTNLESEINRKKEWREEVSDKLLLKLKKAKTDLKEAEAKKADVLSNALYQNSFEWRFEFPEVLDDDKKFVGFDIIIGNPPYIPLEELSVDQRGHFREKFPMFERKFETSVLFIVQSLHLLNPNGLLAFIAPVTWQTGENYPMFREYLLTRSGVVSIVNLPFNVFADAYVETAIYVFSMKPTEQYSIYSFPKKETVVSLDNITYDKIASTSIQAPKYKIILSPFIDSLLRNLNVPVKNLGDVTISTQGLAGSSFKPTKKVDEKKDFPFLVKGNVYNYDLQVEETVYTSLDQKPTLKRFYDTGPKLLIRRIINRQDRLSVGYTEKRMVFKKDINPFISVDKSFHPKFLLALMASRLVSYIYMNISSIALKDDFRQTTLAELREIPIPVLSSEQQLPFIRLADYVLLLISVKKDASFFERVIDAMVYELYIPDVAKKHNYSVIDVIKNLSPLSEDTEANIKLIERAHKDLASPTHPVANALHKLITISEIATIEGRK